MLLFTYYVNVVTIGKSVMKKEINIFYARLKPIKKRIK